LLPLSLSSLQGEGGEETTGSRDLAADITVAVRLVWFLDLRA
jgi:hypothetical protein